MSLGNIFDRRPKKKYGMSDKEYENRHTGLYIICALIILFCGILDVIFLIGILS